MREARSDICAGATLAVLVGGQSRRMGFSKAHLKINGIPILEALFHRLKWPGPTMLVDARGREKPPGHELFKRVVTDPIDGEGPLRGVFTALDHTVTPALVVIPVDMPFMTFEALGSLTGALRNSATASLALFQREGRVEPLPAAFSAKKARLIVREQLASNHTSLHGLTRVMNTAWVEIDPSWPKTLWVNMNYPSDVEKHLGSKSFGDES